MLTGVFSDYINLLFFPFFPGLHLSMQRLLNSLTWVWNRRFWLLALRLWTCWLPMPKEERSVWPQTCTSALTLMPDKLTWFSRLDRSVRWCRCRQDCVDHGADQQCGQGPWWLLCVCWCGRAYPWGKWLVPWNDWVWCDQPEGYHLQGEDCGKQL